MTNNFGLTATEYEHLCLDLKQGNDTAFRKIYLKYYRLVVHILMKDCYATNEKARDATDMAFAKFHRKLRAEGVQFGQLEAYVIRIAKNEFFKGGKDTLDIVFNNDIEPFMPTNTMTVDNNLFVQMGEAFAFLGTKCQQLLKLHYNEGYDYETIVSKKLLLFPSKEDKDKLVTFASEDAAKTQSKMCRRKLKTQFIHLFGSPKKVNPNEAII